MKKNDSNKDGKTREAKNKYNIYGYLWKCLSLIILTILTVFNLDIFAIA